MSEPVHRCIHAKGRIGRTHTKLTAPGAGQRVGLVLLLWFLHCLIRCKYSGSPPGGISRIPYIWDVCMKVLFSLGKAETNLQNVHYLHPTWVVSAPHTSPLPSQDASHKRLWVETATFRQVSTWRSQQSSSGRKKGLSRDSLQPGSHAEDSHWAGVSPTEQGWGMCWTAGCKVYLGWFWWQQWVGSRACLGVYQVTGWCSPLKKILFSGRGRGNVGH